MHGRMNLPPRAIEQRSKAEALWLTANTAVVRCMSCIDTKAAPGWFELPLGPIDALRIGIESSAFEVPSRRYAMKNEY